jgi:hypothetical protein
MMIAPALGFFLFLIYIALVVYFFMLFSRLVSAVERISQNTETGIAALRETLRQPPTGGA